MRVKISVVFLSFAIRLIQAPALTGQVSHNQGPVIRANAIEVVAPMTARTKDGKLVRDLQVQDLEIYDNNKLQEVTVDFPENPISLLIAVQSSANMDSVLPKVQGIGSMLSDLVAGLNGEVALISFDHRIQMIQAFTSESTKISEALKGLTPGSSGHALVQVVKDAARILQERPQNRRRVLLLIAERGDKGSEGHLHEALAQAQAANVTIYAIDISRLVALTQNTPQPPPPVPTTAYHLPGGAALTPNSIEQQNYYMGNYVPAFVDLFQGIKNAFVGDTMDALTRFTGGREYSFVSTTHLENVIQYISEELHRQYLLTYVPNNQDEIGFHEIRVAVKRPGIDVRTRVGYWLPPKSE